MRRDRYAPTVDMAVTLMGSSLANETKAITFEGGDEFSCGQRPEATVI
jgi:hypothetical protein